MNPYRSFARALKWLWKKLNPGWTVDAAPAGPAVWLVHHRNMHGPVAVMGFAPGSPRLWVLHVFLRRKPCFEHFYGYTLTKRYGLPKPLAFLCAGLLSWVVPPLLRSFGCIPVVRGGGCVATLRQSLAALEAGQSVLLCPDVAYADGASGTGEIYTGFLAMERMYYKKTGAHLPFVPMHCDEAGERVRFGEAVTFEGVAGYRAECPAVARRLREALNRLAEGGQLPAPLPAASLPAEPLPAEALPGGR